MPPHGAQEFAEHPLANNSDQTFKSLQRKIRQLH